MKRPNILAIVGYPGSGKTTSLNYFISRGYFGFDSSEILKELNPKMYNPDTIAENILERIKRSDDYCIVAGIRKIEVIDYLLKFSEVKTLEIYQKVDLRYTRILSRDRSDKPNDYLEFLNRDQREERNGLTSILESYVDVAINNNGDISNLNKQLEEIERCFLWK